MWQRKWNKSKAKHKLDKGKTTTIYRAIHEKPSAILGGQPKLIRLPFCCIWKFDSPYNAILLLFRRFDKSKKIPPSYAFRGVKARRFQGFREPVGGVAEWFIKYLLKRRSKCVENRQKIRQDTGSFYRPHVLLFWYPQRLPFWKCAIYPT